MSVILIAAVDRDMGIGINGNLPWKIKADMDHFKARTAGQTVIMGRKTYESIGGPLPGRHNVVVSRSTKIADPQVETFSNLTRALLRVLEERHTVYIIGGSEIYKQAIEFADELAITHIQASYKCNEFFPAIDPAVWRKAESDPFPWEGVGPLMDLVRYVRQ